MPPVYLQQFLAATTSYSRRRAEELIRAGRVKVNGQVGRLGQKIDSTRDKVMLGAKLIKSPSRLIYYLVNKPVGYTTTLSDRFAAKKVTALVPSSPKVWPVGRLDKDSSGLIILTNDGKLTHQLTHPSFRHPKEYLISLDKPITPDLLSKLTKGVKLKEGLAKADKLKKINEYQISIILHQGWNRQIRRMLAQCGYRVIHLERISIDKIRLGDLKPGQYSEILNLKL